MDAPSMQHDREVLDFLVEFTLDRENGRQLPMLHYLARFPGREEAVAREFLQVQERGRPDAADGARRIGGYRLIAELGRGGQGAVWLARDERLGRDVALKVLHREAGSAASAQRLRREALVAARLDHPSLATVFDVGEDDGRPWLAMRFVPGEPLSALLQRHRTAGGDTRCVRLPNAAGDGREAPAVAAAVGFVARAAHALEIAHAAAVVHRDVKPGNLMVTPSGAPVLVDFGLARDHDSSAACLTHTGEQLGTPAYMAPELLRGGAAVGPAADVWSLGVVLYELLTGIHPFAEPSREAMQRAICERDPAPVRKLNPAVSRGVATVLAIALQKAPQRRYPSAAAFAVDLELVGAGELPRGKAPGPLVRFAVACRRHPVAAVAAGLVFTFASIAIAYLDGAFRVEAELRARAIARGADLRRLARSVLFDSYALIRDLPGAVEANRAMSAQALEYLQLLRAEAKDDPGLRADVVVALLHVGDVLGNPRHANLGQPEAARQHYDEALALAGDARLRAECLLRLGELDEGRHDAAAALARWDAALAAIGAAPVDPELAVLATTLHLRRGEAASWTASVPARREVAMAALQSASETAARHADDARFVPLRASLHTARARLLLDGGDEDGALAAAGAARAELDLLPEERALHLSVRCLRAVLDGIVGTVEWQRGQANDAAERLARAGAVLDELAGLDPRNEQVARFRLEGLARISLVQLDQEQGRECEATLQTAMELATRAAERFGADWFEEQRAGLLTRLGQLRYDELQFGAAIPLLQQVVDVHTARLTRHPADTRIAGQVALAGLRLGWACVRGQERARGREVLEASQARLRELLERDPSVIAWRKGLVTCSQQLGELAFQGGDFAAAERCYAAAIAAQRELPAGAETDRSLAILHQGLGEACLQQGLATDACQHGEVAVATLRRLAANAPQDRYVSRLLATSLVVLARFRRLAADGAALGAADEALALVAALDGNTDADTPKLLLTRAMAELLAAVLRRDSGDRQTARRLSAAAEATLARLPAAQRRLGDDYAALRAELLREFGVVETGR